MSEYSFTPQFITNYTFYPEFSEMTVLYRGIANTYIGSDEQGSELTNRKGHLYAEYVDEQIQHVGPVTTYAYAVQEGVAGPGTDIPNEQAFLDVIMDTAQNALESESSAEDSEAYAKGTRDGTPVTSGDASYHNNSKYFCDQAKLEKDSAANSATEALGSANTAALWANGTATGTPSSTNNSLYFAGQAQLWVTGGSSGTPSATNNAKYYTEQLETRISQLNNFLSSATSYYQNSVYGNVIPQGTWTTTINPEKGKYTWTKTVLSWTTDEPDTVMYDVSYIGNDGDNVQTITNEEIDALFT